MACFMFLTREQHCMNVPSTHSHVNMNDIKQSCYVCVHVLNKHWRLFLESWNECPETLCMCVCVRFETWDRSGRRTGRSTDWLNLLHWARVQIDSRCCQKHFSRSKKCLWWVMGCYCLSSSAPKSCELSCCQLSFKSSIILTQKEPQKWLISNRLQLH